MSNPWQHKPPGGVKNDPEDRFVLDLESKIDVLKNVSTDMFSELSNSRKSVENLREGFDNANSALSNVARQMAKIADAKTAGLSTFKLSLLVAGVLSVLYVGMKLLIRIF